MLDYNLTFEQNIKIIKDKKNIFIEERDLLLKSLIKNNDYSKKIIEILSKSKMLSQDEILEKMKYYFPLIKSKSLQNNIYSSLKDLEESDLILGLEKDGYLNNKTYFVNDLFGYFNYYWWSSEFKKDLNFNSQEYNNWKGQAFEIFIFNHLEFFLKDLNIDIGNYEKILNFNSSNKKVKLSKIEKERKDDFLKKNKKAQIDLLIKQKSKKENVYSIIECKYYNKEFLLYEKELDDLNNKMIELHYLIGEKNIQNLILITLNGSKIMDKNYSLLSNIIHLNLSNYLID